MVEELKVRDGTRESGTGGSDLRADEDGDNSDDAGKRSPSDRDEARTSNEDVEWEEEDSDGAWESVDG